MVNDTVVSQHAEEAAFLWTMRNRAISEPQYALKDLAALDKRVEAHLDGLRVAGDAGWNACIANLESLGPGEVFALSVLAFGAGDRERMTRALHAGCSSDHVVAGLISAIGWLNFDEISTWLQRLLEAKAPNFRAVGIRGYAIHRKDPASALESAARDPDPRLRACALRAIGELRCRDLASELRAQLQNDDDGCRFWAAWALTLNGEAEGLPHLATWFEGADFFAMPALQLGLRALALEDSRKTISALAKNAQLGRRAVIAAGIVGDPTTVPWLIRKMSVPEFARVAGEAFTMITGEDLVYADLDTDTPPTDENREEVPIDEVLDLDYESNLPWPSPPHIEAWWEANGQRFQPGIRYLGGQPINPQSVIDVLTKGKQRLRAAAAIELALLHPENRLFEVRARGDWQERDLAS